MFEGHTVYLSGYDWENPHLFSFLPLHPIFQSNLKRDKAESTAEQLFTRHCRTRSGGRTRMPASSQPPYGITPWSTPQTTTPPSRGHWRMLPGKPGPPSKTGHSICQFVQGVIPLPAVDEGSEASPISTEAWVIIETQGILSTMK